VESGRVPSLCPQGSTGGGGGGPERLTAPHPVHLAVKNAHIDVVRWMLETAEEEGEEAGQEGGNKEGSPPLSNKISSMNCLIRARGPSGKSLAEWASEYGHVNLLAFFIKDLGIAHGNGLQLATMKGHMNAVKWLVENGAGGAARAHATATEYGRTAVAKFLKAHRAEEIIAAQNNRRRQQQQQQQRRQQQRREAGGGSDEKISMLSSHPLFQKIKEAFHEFDVNSDGRISVLEWNGIEADIPVDMRSKLEKLIRKHGELTFEAVAKALLKKRKTTTTTKRGKEQGSKQQRYNTAKVKEDL